MRGEKQRAEKADMPRSATLSEACATAAEPTDDPSPNDNRKAAQDIVAEADPPARVICCATATSETRDQLQRGWATLNLEEPRRCAATQNAIAGTVGQGGAKGETRLRFEACLRRIAGDGLLAQRAKLA